MKTIKFEIVKKNRVYFAALLGDKKIPCKIEIDENSKDLSLGLHELAVEDVSVRTKYGTELKYKLAAAASEQKEAEICTLQHPRFNANLVEKCKELGGRYDSGVWVFSSLVADKVDDLDEIYNSAQVSVQLTALVELNKHTAPLTVVGYTIARAFGRDSGARLGDGIALLEGAATSSGSTKNWYTTLSAGAVIRMQIPEKLIADIDDEKWKIEII